MRMQFPRLPIRRFLRKFNISIRLSVSFIVLIALIALVISVGLWQVQAIRLQAEQLVSADRKALSILRVHNELLRLGQELHFLAERREADQFVVSGTTLHETIMAELDDAIGLFSLPSPVEEGRQAILIELQAIKTDWDNRITEMLQLAAQDDWEAVDLRLQHQIEQGGIIAQNLVEKMNAQADAERTFTRRSLFRTNRWAIAWLIGAGLLALVSSGILGYSIIRSITKPLKRLGRLAQALAEGNFSINVPIDGEDELAGLTGVFNHTAEELAKLYADLESMVEQRTQELHRRALQLETSVAMGQRMTSILKRDVLLKQAVQLIKTQYGYQYVGLFLLNRESTHLILQTCAPASTKPLNKRIRIPLETNTLMSRVIEHRQPVCVNELTQEYTSNGLQTTPQSNAKLLLPLKMGKDLFGILDIESAEVNAFLEEDIPVLQSLADQVAIAIQNASLYEKEQARRKLVETLHRAGQALARTLDLKEVLELILAYLADIVPYDRAALLLRRENHLEFWAAKGFPEQMDHLKMHINIQENDVFEKIYQTKKPLIIDDVQTRTDWQNFAPLPQARAWMGLPLIRFGEVIGMLSVTRETNQAYRQDDVALAMAFAGQSAIALENARLYDEITRFSQNLELKIRERTKALQVAYDQLERIDKTKSDFITITAHELRTPLTVLRGYSQMLLHDTANPENSTHLELITGIYTGITRLSEIVNNLLDMTKIDSRSLELYPEPLSLPALIQDVVTKLNSGLVERKMALTIEPMPDLPLVEADPDALSKVFYHIITNAIKYTPDGGTITIQGHAQAPGVQITIQDSGIGIDPTYHQLIFTKFYQTGELAYHSSSKTKFKGGGPGLGLAIAKGIVEAHQGQLWVESDSHSEVNCPGSQFHILLPLQQHESTDLKGANTHQEQHAQQDWLMDKINQQ